jgi:hypothetical protein
LKTVLAIEIAACIDQMFRTSYCTGGAEKLDVGQSSSQGQTEKLSQEFHGEGFSVADSTLKVLLLKSLSGTLPSFTVT